MYQGGGGTGLGNIPKETFFYFLPYEYDCKSSLSSRDPNPEFQSSGGPEFGAYFNREVFKNYLADIFR